MADPTSTADAGDRLPSLELICFGPPTVRVGGRDAPPEVLWRKHLALLVYLALSPERMRSRDHLLGLLWPEKEEAKARHSLNEALRRLRQSLGTGRLLSSPEGVTLTGDALEVDALQFDQAVAREPQAALRVVRGDFLEGLAVPDAPGFEEWASGVRTRYRSRAADALVREGERLLAASRFADARDLGRRALTLEPYSEPGVRLVLRAAALAADQAGALAAFHDFRGRLERDVGEAPSRALVALSERIRRGGWRRPAGVGTPPEPAVGGEPAGYREAFALVADGLARGPRTLVVVGEPGMGKSRLAAECADRLALEGAVVATARPLESDSDARWSTLRQLFRGGLLAAPGLAAADPAALAPLAALAPELAERVTPVEPRDHAQVGAALASVARAVADEQPLGLVVDDAHFADGATLAALHAALQALRDLPLVTIVTSIRATPATPRELLRLQSEIGDRIPGTSVALAPLPDGAMRALVDAMAPWCEADEARDRLTRRLAFETGGNPFLAVTLLRGLAETAALRADALRWPPPRATLEAALPMAVPNLARAAVVARISRLSEPARRVATAASIGGRGLDPDLITSLSNLAQGAVDAALSELERADIVSFDGERYAFTAPLVAEVVRAECLTPGERRQLAARALDALRPRADLESRLLRAELQASAEAGPNAFEEAIAVARQALGTGADRAARRALRAAERALGSAGGAGARELEELRMQLAARET